MKTPDASIGRGWLRATGRGVEISVLVLPRSSRSAIVGIQDDALKIKLTKPPVDGQANGECCRLIAKQLGISRTEVTLLRGAASRRKVLLVTISAPEEVVRRLGIVVGV